MKKEVDNSAIEAEKNTIEAEDSVKEAENSDKEAENSAKKADSNMKEVYLDYNDREKYPVTVIVNGVRTIVPRGKKVLVSAAVAEVLENAKAQKIAAERFADENSYKEA